MSATAVKENKSNLERENCYWREEEDRILDEMAGVYPIHVIANKLKRPAGGVIRRMERLGIAQTRSAMGMITAHELSKILKVDSHTVLLWIDKYGLKSYKKIARLERVNIYIQPEEFWIWAKENKSRLNFSKIPKNTLNPEPDWVDKQRQTDFFEKPARQQAIWKPKEDALLLSYANHGLSNEEIAEKLGRSKIGVRKRLLKLRKFALEKINK